MPIFRRKPKVPEWAAFMSEEEYVRFLGLVDGALTQRGVEHSFEDNTVVTSDGEVYGLVNLAQMCRGEQDWPEVVSSYFDSLLAGAGEEPPERFADAAPLLRTRLTHPESLGGTVRVAMRPVADLVLALACDFPNTIGYVREEDVERWGRPFDELLEIGLKQVREREEPPSREQVELDDGTVIRALFGDSLFTSTHALWMDDGLLAIPHRHAVLWHPLEEIDSVLNAINHLIGMAGRMFEEGPGSTTDQLYWKRGDEIVLLPVQRTGDASELFPPDEFVAELNRLAQTAPE